MTLPPIPTIGDELFASFHESAAFELESLAEGQATAIPEYVRSLGAERAVDTLSLCVARGFFDVYSIDPSSAYARKIVLYSYIAAERVVSKYLVTEERQCREMAAALLGASVNRVEVQVEEGGAVCTATILLHQTLTFFPSDGGTAAEALRALRGTLAGECERAAKCYDAEAARLDAEASRTRARAAQYRGLAAERP